MEISRSCKRFYIRYIFAKNYNFVLSKFCFHLIENEICYFLTQGGVNLDDVGFEIVGGKDDPQFPNDNSIYVCLVNKNSPAYGKLK